MKKINLIKKPDLFQGEKYLKKYKDYFEGWYFKITNNKTSISFIPGISINKEKKCAFIQVITNKDSYYFEYDIDEFKYGFDPFYVMIGDNFFSKDGIYICIKDKRKKDLITGAIEYSDSENINTNFLNPNIMGIFSYVPFMECNHAILCMNNKVNGFINIKNKKIMFDDGSGYIEKDWGTSFPKSYIWCQGNCFRKNKASFMLSIASVPFKIFSFTGVICSLIVDDKEYRFATYNNTKIIKYEVGESIDIILKRGKYFLYISSDCLNGHELLAPSKGRMDRDIIESISALVTVTLKKHDKVIFSDTSTNCGLEIV